MELDFRILNEPGIISSYETIVTRDIGQNSILLFLTGVIPSTLRGERMPRGYLALQADARQKA